MRKEVFIAFDMDDVRRCCCKKKKPGSLAECHVAAASKRELKSSGRPWSWNKMVCPSGYKGESGSCGKEWEWLEVYDREGEMGE